MSGPGGSHVQTHEMLESQNDQMVTQMADKVKQLKSVRIRHRHEHMHIRTHNDTHIVRSPLIWVTRCVNRIP